MSDEIKMTPETGMTDEEIAELEKQREAAREARLAPFKALRQRMDAGLRYAVANDGVTDEELLTMSAATPEWKPGMTLAVGDTVMHGGSMFVVIQAHTTQAGWEPGTATQSLFRRVQQEGSTEWQPDTDYATGAECTYEGSTYTCLQGHTSQAGWEPPNVPSLWKLKTE
ncbi:MAG: hypothetical protein IJB81_09050 [Clostridia bacterium]|nr:hypothetical protein [Clostridia bacterium]